MQNKITVPKVLSEHNLAYIKKQFEYIQKTLAPYKQIIEQISQNMEVIRRESEKLSGKN